MRRTLIALLLGCAPAARAQQADGGVEFFQSTLSEIMDTPLLAASYAEERPSDAAATAYVVTAETIEKRGYASLAELLNDVPQFQMQMNSDEGRLNVVTTRGIPNNEKLVVLYDGVRLTPPSGDMLVLAGNFSLKGAERVEIVLGPMSSLYGADAFSGVVNVVTRAGARSEAGASYGSFSARNSDLTAASRLSRAEKGTGAPAASVTYAASVTEGPVLPDFYKSDFAWYNGPYQGGTMRYVGSTVTATVPVRPYDARQEASFLNARLSLENFELGFIRMSEAHSSSVGVMPEYSLHVKDARFGTTYRTLYGRHVYASPDGDWTLTTLISHYDYTLDPETMFLNSYSDYQPAYKYSSAQTVSVQETLAFEPAAGYPMLLGFSYQQNSVLPYSADLSHKFDTDKSPLSQGFTYTGSTIPVDFYSLNYSNTGAFARVQTRELGDVSLSLSLRYDLNTAYGETWNPRTGLVWRPGGRDDLVAKVLYGEAFLAPSPDKTHRHFGSFVSSPTATSGYHSYFFHVPNDNLDPEKVRSVEGSLTRSFGRSFRVSLNPYYTKVRDLIQDVSTGPGLFKGVEVDNIERAENRGSAETYGFTLRADAVLHGGRWSYEPWCAYTRSQATLAGDPMPFNSLHTVQAGVSALRGRWAFTPKVLYRSYSRNQDGGRVAPFAVVDFYLRYYASRLKTGGLSAHLGLKNLLDRRYYNAAYGGGPDTMDGAPQNPFELTLGLSYKF